jgi:hypothetical protein
VHAFDLRRDQHGQDAERSLRGVNVELIHGHNQFIGISHISEERGQEREKTFSKVENVYRVVEAASAVGFKHMITETHRHARVLSVL